MKFKIIRIWIVTLLGMCSIVACNEERWELIELSDNTCENVIGVIRTLENIDGTIIRPEDSPSIFLIEYKDETTSGKVLLLPCNLPEEYQKNGQRIQFSGDMLDIKDWIDGFQTDLIAKPIKILTAKIKK